MAGEIHFAADYHFGDDWIAKFENREIDTRDTAEIVRRHNNVVEESDTVYFAGDMATKNFAMHGFLKSVLDQMNGRKVLILGNHDREISEDPGFWLKCGFDEVSTNPVVIEDFFIVSHEPMYVSEQMPYVNLFGHVHGNTNYNTFSSCGACICIERHGYAPVSLSTIKREIGRYREGAPVLGASEF